MLVLDSGLGEGQVKQAGCSGSEGNSRGAQLRGLAQLQRLNFGRLAVCLRVGRDRCVQPVRAPAVTIRGDPEGKGVDRGKDERGTRLGMG